MEGRRKRGRGGERKEGCEGGEGEGINKKGKDGWEISSIYTACFQLTHPTINGALCFNYAHYLFNIFFSIYILISHSVQNVIVYMNWP